jgi:uncharacterized protein YqhQ
MDYGGKALLNGVMLESDDVQVIARRINNKIKVTDDVDFEEYEYVENDEFDLDYFIKKIPFVRGIWDFGKSIISAWKYYLITGLLLFISTQLFDNTSNKLNISDQFVEYIIYITVIVMLVLFKISPISKYHAAEHMASNCYNKGKPLTLQNVMKQSRIHEDCGTNFVIFVAMSWLFLIFVPYTSNFYVYLRLIIAWSIGYEFFVIENTRIKTLLKPVYLIGYTLQYVLFTAKPKVKHVEVAISALKRLDKLQTKIDKM